MPHIIGFCGASQSGKTTLVVEVIKELTRRGLKVAAIKHHGHDSRVERPEVLKDSRRLAEAGAGSVALSYGGGALIETDQAPQDPAGLAAWHLPAVDLVLVEGFKKAAIDKVEVVAPGREPILPPGGRILAITRRGGSGREAGLPVLDADRPGQVADFVRDWLDGQENNRQRVHIKVDGRELEMDRQAAEMIEASLKDVIGGLRDAQGAKRIEVLVE